MVLIQIMCLEDLARAAELGAILLLCHGNESMSKTFYLSLSIGTVYCGFTQSSSVSPTTRKNLSCLNNFYLAVHQITLGS